MNGQAAVRSIRPRTRLQSRPRDCSKSLVPRARSSSSHPKDPPMATKGSRRSDAVHGDGVKMAQSGGVSKGTPSKPSDQGGHASSNSGLKQAWADQTARPSVLNNMG